MKYLAYPTYRPSGVEWLGVVPQHWEVKRLRNLLSRNDGGVWGDEDDPNGMVVLRSTEQTLDGGWRIEDPARRALSDSEKRDCALEAGDLVVTKSSGSALHIGKTSLVTADVAALAPGFSNFMQRLRFSKAYDPRLGFYQLNSPTGRQQLVFNSNTTTGLANLNGSVLGNVLVGLPPPDEQCLIGDFLDAQAAKLDTLVAKKRALIERLTEKRTSLISRTVTRGLPRDDARAAGLDPQPKLKASGFEWLGDVPAHWEVKAFRRVIDRLDQGWSPIGAPWPADGEEWGVLKLSAARRGAFLPSENKALDEDLVEGTPLVPQAGDLLVSRSNTPERVGDVCIVLQDHPRLLIPDLLYRVKVNLKQALPAYVCFFLLSRAGRAQIEADARGSSGSMVKLGQDHLRSWPVPCPPLREQQAIADYLDRETVRIDQMVAKVEAAIERLQEYRAALITAAVTGKIDVRGHLA